MIVIVLRKLYGGKRGRFGLRWSLEFFIVSEACSLLEDINVADALETIKGLLSASRFTSYYRVGGILAFI